jgi:hypothetical protein
MPRGFWFPSVRFGLPENVAAMKIEAINHPVMDALGRLSATLSQVETLPGFLVFFLTHDCG